MSPDLIAELVAACLVQIPPLVGPHAEILDFAAWLQTWPDTSCGHGNGGGQAFTRGLVVAAIVQHEEEEPVALVWSGARLLHRLPATREVEWAIRTQRVPGLGGRWPVVPE